MTPSDFEQRASALRSRYDAVDGANSGQRSRNRAAALGVSEAELVAASCGPIRSRALRGPAQEIFRELGCLGRIMALTRNEWCVHERRGRYETVHADGPVGLVLGPDIDLRIFFSSWKSAWAVDESGRRSLQFFDGSGAAVHKIYRTDETDETAFDALIERFAEPAPEWPAPAAPKAGAATAPLSDPAAFRQAWLAMADTHEFAGLLKTFNVARTEALAAVGPDLAQQVDPKAIEEVLEKSAASGLPIMCFVGNRGMIQIHTGPIVQLRRTGPWYNVLDPEFNLHLNTDSIASVWAVSKPTSDGWVASLEVFSTTGELIVQFFGARKPGQPALPQWGRLLTSLCRAPLTV